MKQESSNTKTILVIPNLQELFVEKNIPKFRVDQLQDYRNINGLPTLRSFDVPKTQIS